MDDQANAMSAVRDGAQLKQYTLAKQEVADAIRATTRILEARGMADEVAQSQALLVRLAEDRFNLAVVGQFKRGKSSLMNAVIGRDLLPTGVLPLTSAITTLCYGPEERVLLKRKGWGFDQEVPLSELAPYVTEEGNPGNEQALLEARVVVPVPFLRRGLHFIDTPGVGSARTENTETTYAFLPDADAVIFVTSVEAPLSEAEHRFLREIRRYAPKLFVVVNKVDVLAPGERERVLRYIAAGIAQTLAVDEARVLPVSARQGLAAKVSHDRAGVRASGLEAFEDTLAEFLAAEKERTFLLTIVDRARQLLSGDSTEAEEVRARMASMRSRLLAGRALAGAGGRLTTGGVDPYLLEHAVAVKRAPFRAEDVRARTCPVCAAHAEMLFSVLARWQHMLATDDAARCAFAAGRGFCPLHTWQFEQLASPQGISEGYAPLVVELPRFRGG
jgi:predicted GTPase